MTVTAEETAFGIEKMLTEYEKKLVNRAIHRKKIFLTLSIISVVIALSLAIYYVWELINVPNFDKGIHFVLVILILLNARQNLRQYNYAKIFETVIKNQVAS